jgi:putative transcriptional regulator
MDDDMFNELLASVKEMDSIEKKEAKPSREFNFPDPEVKGIREKTGLSQLRFATMIGVSKRTLENWEQGRRHPTGPAKALLRIVEADPQYALHTLHGSTGLHPES